MGEGFMDERPVALLTPGQLRFLGSSMSPFRASAALTKKWKSFRVELDGGVVTITLDRPEKLNALTFEAYADLRDLLAELPHRGDAPRVVVITGEGRGFCSGGDVEEIIGELQKMDVRELLDFTRMTGAVVRGIRDCPLPVIAAVNGIAAGAGAVIALACDLRLLAASAKFAFLFTRVGLAGADMGSAYLLPRIVGLGRASELLLLGDRVDAERAVAIGLASEVVPDVELATRSSELAKRLAGGPALAHEATKLLISRELDTDFASAIELEAVTQALLMKSDDHGEFYAAFKAGRDPDWTGR
jgi:enoyl-CoA hydratase/carnithine racemase